MFSPLIGDAELRAGEILKQEHPTAASPFAPAWPYRPPGPRERRAAERYADRPGAQDHRRAEALADSGIDAPLFLTQNDGTVTLAENARLPGAFLRVGADQLHARRGVPGQDQRRVVCDGGTTADDVLRRTASRQANNMVEVGGVRTAFRMPDLLSIGGGGTLVNPDTLQIGPVSVGHRLLQEALVFGGNQLTHRYRGGGPGDIGDRSRVAHQRGHGAALASMKPSPRPATA